MYFLFIVGTLHNFIIFHYSYNFIISLLSENYLSNVFENSKMRWKRGCVNLLTVSSRDLGTRFKRPRNKVLISEYSDNTLSFTNAFEVMERKSKREGSWQEVAVGSQRTNYS